MKPTSCFAVIQRKPTILTLKYHQSVMFILTAFEVDGVNLGEAIHQSLNNYMSCSH